MENLGYYNGRYDTLDKMMIPMNDRVCYFGDGVYDAGPCRNGIIFAIDEHIDRFFNSASLVDIQMPVSKQELKDILNEMVLKVDADELFVYYQVTRGTEIRNHAYKKTPANLWIMIKPSKFRDISEKIQVITAEDTRFFHCNIKTLNLLPSVMYAQKAESQGCFETILHRNKRITECAHSNVHIIKDSKLYTAPLDNLILPGIARAHLIRMCEKFGIEVCEEEYYLEDLMNAEEVLVTSSSNLCLAVDKIDGKEVGGKQPKMLKKLQKALLDEFYEYTDIKKVVNQ